MTGSERRPRRPLNTDLIVQTTLDLIDDEGIGAASMRTIGSRLGVEAMALYRYFSSRDQILDAVVDRIVDELGADPDVFDTADGGWRDYLSRLADGVRRYALAHPRAFPLVTTRPAEAPWVNPPLRSLAWIESMLRALAEHGFHDDQIVYAYRSFNSFLLGYLLLETGALTLVDPQDGDGTYAADDTAATTEPVPGGLTPARSDDQQEAITQAAGASQLIDPVGEVDAAEFPNIHRLAPGLAESHVDQEFHAALVDMLDRIEARLTA